MEPKTATFNEISFPVQGMSCGSCVRHIQAPLEAAPASSRWSVEVNLVVGEVTISYNPQTTEPGAIAQTIQYRGYRPGIPRTE